MELMAQEAEFCFVELRRRTTCAPTPPRTVPTSHHAVGQCVRDIFCSGEAGTPVIRAGHQALFVVQSVFMLFYECPDNYKANACKMAATEFELRDEPGGCSVERVA